MQFTLLDPHVDETMNAFLVLANVLNLVYNAPQVWQTYRTKSTTDINPWFIGLRIAGNCIWISYSIYINSFFLLLNNTVTVLSSVVLAYYKYQNRHKGRPALPNAASGAGASRTHGRKVGEAGGART